MERGKCFVKSIDEGSIWAFEALVDHICPDHESETPIEYIIP